MGKGSAVDWASFRAQADGELLAAVADVHAPASVRYLTDGDYVNADALK